jgi:hypothetical protein
MSNELNINDELYSDIAIQMFSAYIGRDKNASVDLMKTYEKTNDEDPVFFPGVILGCMIHMSVLLSTVAENSGISIEDAFALYANVYNLEIRESLNNIPTLHQGFALKLYEKIREAENI